MTFTHIRLAVLLFVAISAEGQQLKLDTAFLSAAKNNQVTIYEGSILGQTRLNNGSAYRDYLSRDEEHPYFGVDDWTYGTIVYDDQRYDNVALFYDLLKDKVIAEHSLNGAKLELINNKVKQFTMGGHTFVRLKSDESKGISEEGFYDLLYDGKTKVYVRRKKELQQRLEATEIIATFDVKNRIFILKDGMYIPVKNKNSLLDVFKDKKQDVRAFMNKSGKKFKSDREGATVAVARFYDSQNN